MLRVGSRFARGWAELDDVRMDPEQGGGVRENPRRGEVKMEGGSWVRACDGEA